jgi:ferritin-like metal-binding protein YciE
MSAMPMTTHFSRNRGIPTMATSKRDTLIVGLRNAYALEGQALSTMENVHSRLESYPELKAGVAQHIEETKGQQQMVEQCLSRFGESPSTIKEAAMRLAGNVQSLLHGAADDEVLKNLFALYAFEHFEIASYKSLIAMAQDCGETEVAQTCSQILRQEQATAQKLEGMIEPISRTYLQREAADQQASR